MLFSLLCMHTDVVAQEIPWVLRAGSEAAGVPW